MMQVRIYKPAKSAMQSGDGNDLWMLEFVNAKYARFKENLMARTSSNDMANEVKLKFDSYQSAVKFAESQNYQYEVIQPRERKLVKKSYAENFSRRVL